MRYKVGQRFRIKTLKEAQKDAPQKAWNSKFFDTYANRTFVIRWMDSYSTGVILHGDTDNEQHLKIRTRINEHKALQPLCTIELDNSLFEL